jgi:hypothetical protein
LEPEHLSAGAGKLRGRRVLGNDNSLGRLIGIRKRTLRGRLAALPAIAVIVLSTSGALAASASPQAQGAGGIGVRLLAAGANPGDQHAATYIVARLAPGGSIRRRIEIINSTRSTALIAVYPAAAGIVQGTFEFAPSHTANGLSRWTSVSQNVLRLAAGTKALETVTIKVPRNASRGPGYGVVWAEVSAPAPAGGGVRLVNRVGVRMYVSVGPGGALRSDFAIGRLSASRSAAGDPVVVADIRNTGQRALNISGSLALSNGPDGVRTGLLPVTLAAPLAPGVSERVTVRLDKRLPAGPWRAQMRLRSGLTRRAAAATITFPSATTAATGPPMALLVTTGLLVLLAVAALGFIVTRGPDSRSAASDRNASAA